MKLADFRKEVDVDILIRGLGNLELTNRCIDSIIRNTPSPSYHITYVDNGSPDRDTGGLLDLVLRRPDRRQITSVLLPFNHGSVRAINDGLSLALHSKAPYILLLDNDTEIPDGDTEWLQRFIGYLDDPQVGAAGAVSNYVAGVQHIEQLPPTYQKEWEDKEKQRGGVKGPVAWPLLVSFAMLIRKGAFKKVGFFDERFEPGNCEDYDYAFRLLEAGYKTVVAQSVWIHHKGSSTYKAQFDFGALLARNKGLLVAKYGRDRLAALGVEVGS